MRKFSHVAWLPILAAVVGLGRQVQAITMEPYWESLYDSPFHGDDSAIGVVVDHEDNIIVTGSVESIPGYIYSADIATVKFNPAGETLWARHGAFHLRFPSWPEDITTDNDNNIYVVGTAGGVDTAEAMVTIKYHPNGDTAWVRWFPDWWYSYGKRVAVDAQQNVYAAGTTRRPTGTGDTLDFLLVKYDSSGNQLWMRYGDGPSTSGYDILRAMALDPVGNIILVGSTADTLRPLSRNFLTVKFSPDGDTLWSRYLREGDTCYPTAVTTDDGGNIYVGGAACHRTTTRWDYFVVKYNPAGETLLTAWYNNQVTNDADNMSALAVDRFENIYATGTSNDTVEGDPTDRACFATVKWAPSGGLPTWIRKYRGTLLGSESYATAMKLDRHGNIYVTGSTENDYSSCLEQGTLKYDPYGSLKWEARVADSSSGAHGRALALDSRGSVYVAGDGWYADNARFDYTLTRFSGPNVGVARVVEPRDTIRVNRTVIPTVMVYNYSPIPATNVPVFMLIGSTMFTLTVPSLGAYDSTSVLFNSWSSRDAGDFPITAYTTLTDDWENGDDTARGYVTVVLPWVQKDSLPLGPKRKYIKDGGSLAYDSSLNVIYAVKGNNTCEFYSYGPVGTWVQRDSVPVGAGRRKVKKGAELVYGGSNTVYLAKGNRTAEFWAYNPQTGWVQKSPLPSVLKGGTAVAYAPNLGRIYVLPGSNTRQMWTYDTNGTWTTGLPDVPSGPKNKQCKDGTSLAYDGSRYVYALKGKTSEFYAYDAWGNTWMTKDLLPNSTRTGKKKTSGDGASFAFANGMVYAFKGNNTNEFWGWNPAADTWTELDSMTTGLKKKKVKAGGSLVAVRGKVYALRGNGTNDFYMYNANVQGFFVMPGQPGGQGGATVAGLKLGMRVAPNPFRGSSVVTYALPKPGAVSVRLYEVTGRLGLDLFSGRQRAGSYRLSLADHGLSAGVYFLKLRFDDGTGEQQVTAKVLVER